MIELHEYFILDSFFTTKDFIKEAVIWVLQDKKYDLDIEETKQQIIAQLRNFPEQDNVYHVINFELRWISSHHILDIEPDQLQALPPLVDMAKLVFRITTDGLEQQLLVDIRAVHHDNYDLYLDQNNL